MLLIYPPVTKGCEPPPGICRLAGSLKEHGIPYKLWDANLEGQLWLLEQLPAANDTWSSRAWRSKDKNLEALRDSQTYLNQGKYKSAVNDLNRLLILAGKSHNVSISLSDYRDANLSPLRSPDLLASAANPELNPFYDFFIKRLPELLNNINSVGISINFLNQAICGFSLIGLIRMDYPKLKIVVGGGLVTSWMARPDWKNPFSALIDNLISGSGEGFLLKLYGYSENPKPSLPCYDQLPLEKYLSPDLILPYSTSSGCWWNRCSFCPEKAEGNRYLPLPVSEIARQLPLLVEKYRPKLLHLLDNAIPPSLLEWLIKNPPGVNWYGFIRFEKRLTDPVFCISLRRSGCVMLKIGIESGDQAVLNSLNKGINLDMAALILENLKKAGIAVYAYLLFGTPAEDPAAAGRTLEFVQRHHVAISFLNLAIFNMPVFGEDVEEHETELFYEGDLSLYTGFRHPSNWHRGKVRRFLRQQFSNSPEIGEILRRNPPQFSSNHAAFFTGYSCIEKK